MSGFTNVPITLLILLVSFLAIQARSEYTAEEKNALVKFRELVRDVTYKDYMRSDPYLIRWIRAKNFDLEEANQMLRRAMQWRKHNKIDGILNEAIWQFKPPAFYIDGLDYEGSRGYPGRVDMRQAMLNGKRPEAIRYFSQLMEIMEKDSLEALGIIGNSSAPERDRADLFTYLVDLNGYSFRQHGCLTCLAVYAEWIQQFENYYPSYFKHLIAVNVPRVATPLVQLILPLLSEPLRKAVKIYGSNKSEWIPVLRKIIPPDQLRVNFGGTKSD